ncbi:MAG: serine hydrolase domain-containing protein [Bacteroidota bacterium]
MMKSYLLLPLTLFLFFPISAQPFDSTKLDAYFEALETNDKFMGTVAIARNGRIFYTNSVGYQHVDKKITATDLSQYRIGSISKTFTATLIFKAIEDELLDLNQSIDTFFSKLENASDISILSLLNHSSGIHNFTNDSTYVEWNTKAKSREKMLDIIRDAGSDFSPGSNSSYSNSNYVLLSYILEDIYKMKYGEILSELITKPLKLESTSFGNANKSYECASYNVVTPWEMANKTHVSVPMGAGGITSTCTDLIRFSNALFDGELVNEASLRTMKLSTGRYGCGLFKIPFYDKVAYGHTGGIDGFSSIFAYFPEEDVTYAMTSNGATYNINDISIAALSAVFGKEYSIPEFKYFETSPDQLQQYIGTYTSEQLPLEIRVGVDENDLMAQATGQSAIPLTATDQHIFRFDKAGLEMVFDPSAKSMMLKQGGGEFTFTLKDD